MPRATFTRLLDSSIAFNRFLLEQLNERLAQFIAMLEYERLMDPESRVARCLAWLFNPFLYPGVGQKLRVSQEEIGNLSGISRQRVNQALQALERDGLLRVEYGGVTILDLEGLRQR
jgi:CRP/FNR family cyclic AMP-dependent transcriptional regulator